MHEADGAGWALVLILLLLMVAAVAVLVTLLLRTTQPLTPVTGSQGQRSIASEAEQILRRRFASGEIDEEEFRRRTQALDEAR